MAVYYVEEPVFDALEQPWLELRPVSATLTVGVPHVLPGLDDRAAVTAQHGLMQQLCAERGIINPMLWFYTPMAIAFAGDIAPAAIVYDCMDELSAFKFAPPEAPAHERDLLQRADVVFTGGFSLYEAKRTRHPRVHAFPSAVDLAHFATARHPLPEPADQAGIPHPRLGFFGVIDERMDTALLASVAVLRPDWHIVMIGPVVKIDAASLPDLNNIHYLGGKTYEELPAYAAHWEVALMPFARNEATRFISPTKMPEYLAAGKPVVSTPIADVTRRWAHLQAAFFAETPEEFVLCAAAAIALGAKPGSWLEEIDRELADLSWDRTWQSMWELIQDAVESRPLPSLERAQ
jgi:UDP-galactopyranose mutase